MTAAPLLEHLKHGLAIERQANTDLAYVFGNIIFTPTRENRAILYDSLSVVGREVLHGDLLTWCEEPNYAMYS